MPIFAAPAVELVWITPGAQEVIEWHGRKAYKSQDKIGPGTAGPFIRGKLLSARNGLKHESVLEHASASFDFVTNRGVTHELVRHRIASFTQESTRFCNYAKEKFGGEIQLDPMNDGLTADQLVRRMKLWQHIEEVYFAEIAEGVKPQQARDVLPTCLKSDIGMTANLREWRHVFQLRSELNPDAHPKIRALIEQCRVILKRETPDVFFDV